jgi:hypothetical protein
VKTTIANALTALANPPSIIPPLEIVTIEQVAHLIQEAKVEIKENVKQNIEQMKDDIVQVSQTYTDIVTELLKESLHLKLGKQQKVTVFYILYVKRRVRIFITKNMYGNNTIKLYT